MKLRIFELLYYGSHLLVEGGDPDFNTAEMKWNQTRPLGKVEVRVTLVSNKSWLSVCLSSEQCERWRVCLSQFERWVQNAIESIREFSSACNV